jgi:glycosyltransferase involved in cell wall biosynthesis
VKKLLVVAPFSVVPPRYGGPLRVFNLCREAGREFRVEQFAQQIQRADMALSLSPLTKTVTDTYSEHASRNPLSLALYALTSLRFRSPPVWGSWRLSLGSPRWLRDRIRDADVIHVEHPWQFESVARLNGGRAPIVYGAANVEADLYPADRIRAPKAIATRIAAAILRQERLACREATHVVAVTGGDAAVLVDRYGVKADKVSIVPNGVDCERFRPASPELRAARKEELGLGDRKVVVFSGSGHTPNVDAARTIQGWASRWPDNRTRFVIVGSVGRELGSSGDPRLLITGPVEDTRPYFEAADAAVNPMQSGGGTNLKQLEFMAMGLAVVATPVGVRGVEVSPGVDAWVAGVGDIPEALQHLLQDAGRRAAIGAAGRRLVELRYSWESIGRDFRSTLRDLAA